MSLTKFAKTYAANQSKYAHLNAFTTRPNLQPFVDRQLANGEDGDDWKTLDGKPVAVKDNICTKDFPTTAASGMLKGFTSPYDATVVDLLRGAGAEVVGKTNMDEFGMGSHSTHSHAGPVVMERYPGEAASAGGSSGGSAVAVATGQCWAALGTDTGGSVRLPAAYTGTVGFKPSYGLLSRWGVIDYANSLDTVGILTANASGAQDVFAKLNVYDPKDPTSLPPSTRARLKKSEWDGKRPLRIGIPLDYNISTLDPVVRSAWQRALKHLAKRNHTLHPVRLPATQHALSAYYILAPAEASSNLAKYDGVRFGTRADGVDGSPESVLFAKTRGQGFGSEVQRRILLGAFSLSAQAIDNYFIQAQRIRRLVQRDFDNVFAKPNPLRTNGFPSALPEGRVPEEKVDVLLCPTAPTLAPSLAEVKDQDPLQAYMNDVFTVPASLAGLPAVSVPIQINAEDHRSKYGDHDFPAFAGMQVIGQYGDDDLVLQMGHILRRARGHGRCTELNQVRLDPNAWGYSRFLNEAVKEPETKDYSFLIGMSSPDPQEEMSVESKDDALQHGYHHIPDPQERMYAESKDYASQHGMSIPDSQEEIYAELSALLNATVGEQRIAEGAEFYALPQDQYIRQLSESEDPLGAEAEMYEKVQASQIKAGNRLEKLHAVRTVLDSQTVWTKTRSDRYHRQRGIEHFKNRQKSLLKGFEKEHTDEEVEAFKAMQEEELRELEERTTDKAIRFVGFSESLVKRIIK